MVGFVHHLAGVRGDNEIFGYSHVMAVAKDYQNKGVGARLKWAQRERALRDGRQLIKWTWDPMMARNAHFNLNRLGAVVESYLDDFYGIDYGTDERLGLPSDRLSATWNIDTARVHALAKGVETLFQGKRVGTIAIPADWNVLAKHDVDRARAEQTRVREEFHQAFAEGLICAGFERGQEQSQYVLFEKMLTADNTD
jgi:predicted GNAT superfamily acetyltransferase